MTPTQLLDLFLLALCVWREARGEPYRGKVLVATVVLNRARDAKRRWPIAIGDVVTQPLQFSSFNHGDPNALLFPKDGDASWEQCVKAADEARWKADNGQKETTANHYHTAGIETPSWAKQATIVASEGRLIFYHL